jgi:hypothetical protein
MTKVEGIVKYEDGRLATEATVEVHNSTGDIVDQLRTADGGAFTYYLCPGPWNFFTYDGEGHRGNARVTLAEGDAAVRVDVEIK